MVNGFGGPFDITDMFGEDRLTFEMTFVESTTTPQDELAQRAAKLFREAMLIPPNPEESKQKILLTGNTTFEVHVELFQPAASLTGIRDARNELNILVPNALLTTVKVESINVGITGRERALLGKDIHMRVSTQVIADIDVKREGEIEAELRDKSKLDTRIDLINQNSNFAIDLNDNSLKLHELIKFGATAKNVIDNNLDTRASADAISAGNNFNLMR